MNHDQFYLILLQYLRLSHQKALEALEASLEIEIKCKNEAIKQKKLLEVELTESKLTAGTAYKTNSDLQMKNKKQQQRLTELENQIEDEMNQKMEAREAVLTAERRANTLANELDDQLNQQAKVEKALKNLELDLNSSKDRINELSLLNTGLVEKKRKLEQDSNRLTIELEDSNDEFKSQEMKLKKAYEDAGRLAEELRLEQVISKGCMDHKYLIGEQGI